MYGIKERDAEAAAQTVKDTSRLRLKTIMKRNLKLLGRTTSLYL